MAESILENTDAMAAVQMAGYGVLILRPGDGASADDEKIERMVIRMAEQLKEIGEGEDANYPELMCAAIEFAARIIASPFALQDSKRSDQSKFAEGMAKNLKTRILGAIRHQGSGQEQQDN